MKMLGACAVLLASLGFGLRLRRERRRRLACLRALETALRLLSGQLGLRREPMPELFDWLSRQSEGGAARFFSCLTRRLARLGEESFPDIWRACVAESLPELTPEDRRELLDAGRFLGRFELSEQLAGLESCRLRLRARLESGEAAYRDERKLLLALPVCAGCLLVLLIL